MTNADVEIFEKLRYLPSLPVHQIFEIGNAFGYSTTLLDVVGCTVELHVAMMRT